MRLISLDVLRGLTIGTMLLVNFQGDFDATYPPFVHSEWNGCTLADAVFPCFLFIVGMTTHISLQARRARGVANREIVLQIVRRAVILIAIGLFLSAFPFTPATRVLQLRIPGVSSASGARTPLPRSSASGPRRAGKQASSLPSSSATGSRCASICSRRRPRP